ncbi:MAG: aminoacyl-histidine dipeptidase [Blautia sp.]|nr:aminoacyl-histidine dipeptidase [Blautia sp.]
MALYQTLDPERVFYYFEQICSIPHGSGNTAAISNYLAEFASSHGLFCLQDDMGNILIRKAPSAGYENAPGVILQGHMDMVCEKRPESSHDFLKDPLDLQTDGTYLFAKDTTLGGDDGIAVAYALAVLESDTIPHPPLEVLVTVDEEIGLLGAEGFDCSVLQGRRLINIDSEAEGSIWVSCAGGLVGTSTLPVTWTDGEGLKIKVRLEGLTGGHSGAEIDKIRASAVNLMGRLLYRLDEKFDFGIWALAGGSKDNAIPISSEAGILIRQDDLDEVKSCMETLQCELREEYAGSDEDIRITVDAGETGTCKVLAPNSHSKVIFLLHQIPYGVNKMSGTVAGLVETSDNPGILTLDEQELSLATSIRSSINSGKKALSDRIAHLTMMLGGEYEISGEYPAWAYRSDSPLREKMAEVFERLYGHRPAEVAIHAGLECGLFYRQMPDLDCVSIGPDILDIHTFSERLDLASVKRVWDFLVESLAALH